MGAITLLVVLLVLLVAQSAATPPTITSAGYKSKTGQSNQVTASLMEFELNFDQDLHYLEFLECGSTASCPTVDPNTCAPCDYSDFYSSSCGTSPRAPASLNCTCALRSTLCYPTGAQPPPDGISGLPRQLVLNGESLYGNMSFPAGINTFRLYVPETVCSAVRIYAVTIEGQIEFTMNWYPKFSDRVGSSYRWYSYRTADNVLTICPTDPQYHGTFYLKLTGYGTFSINAVTVPLPATDIHPSPIIPPTSPYTQVLSDVPYTVNLNSSGTTVTYTYYSFAVDGPCPRLFGLVAYFYSFAGADLRAVEAVVSTNASFHFQRGIAARPANILDENLWDLSFPTRLAGSFCPDDTSLPTYYYVRLQTAGDEGMLTLYVTTNPQKFIAMPLPPVLWPANPYEVAKTLQTAVAMQCGSSWILPCPDVKARGLTCAKDYYTPIAPLTEVTPLWPPLGIFFDDESSNYDPPSFASNTYVSNRLNWIFVTSLLWDTPDVTLVNETIPWQAIDNCSIRVRPHIVNSLFESLAEPVYGPIPSTSMTCTPSALQETQRTITSLLNNISPINSADVNRNVSHQLDYWNFRDSWQGCLQLTNAMFTATRTVATVNSTFCTDSNRESDPCCNSDGLYVYGCCAARPISLPQNSLATADSVISQVCSLPDCISTYLSTYLAVSNLSCADALATRYRVQNLAAMPVALCQDQVYGPNLDGPFCEVDADCWGYRCDRARLACILPMTVKHQLFIQCIVDTSDELVIRTLAQRSGVDPSLTGDQLATALYAAPIFIENDCVGETEFFSSQEHIEIRWSNSCRALCPSVLYGWNPFASNWPPCGNDVSYGAVPGCEDAREVVFGSSSFSCGRNASRCSVSPFSGPGINASSCDARPNHCALCWNSTFCVPVSLDDTPEDCAITYACELINGTVLVFQGSNYTELVEECESIGDCNVPCYDSTGRPQPCPDMDACLTRGGLCTDVGLFWHNPGGGPPFDPGACVIPRTNTDPCSQTYNGASYDIITTQDYGCVFRGTSSTINTQEGCESTQFRAKYSFEHPLVNGTWRLPATTAAECKAHGCGCERPQFFDMDLGQRTPTHSPWWRGPLSTPEECDACGGFECVDFYTWVPPAWRGGILRPLTWKDPQWLPVLNWQPSFKPTLFVAAVIDAASATWQRQLLSQSQCRFNRISATLQAVACMCTGRDPSSCLSEITENEPIASGYVCGGLAQTVQAVPHTLAFSASSVTPAGRCVDLTFYSVSRLRFANVAPAQSLSTYFTSVKRGTRGSFAFLNSKGAAAGQVAGEGLRIVTPEGVSDVTLCFSTAFIAALTPENDKFSVADIGFTPDDIKELEPMEVTLTQGDYWCASLPSLVNGSYVPVWRSPRWRTIKPPSLTKGQIAVLGLAAAAYFIVSIASVIIGYLVSVHQKGFLVLPRFWLCVLLLVASFVRGIYFALLGSEVIRDSTVTDVILVELPTFVWFTATTLVCLFWFAAVAQKQASRVQRFFWRLFFAVNAVMYIIFIIFVVVFSQLKEEKTSPCNDRLPVVVDRSKRRGAFIAYQIFLAVVALIISLLFTTGGLLIVWFLRDLNKNLNSNTTSESKAIQVGISITAAVCAASFLLHAIFLLVLALTQPGNPYLVIVLVVLEVTPSIFILYSAVPRETMQAISQSASFRTHSGAASTTAGSNSGHSNDEAYVLSID